MDHFIDCFEKCIEDADNYIQKINSLLDDYINGDIASDLRKKILKELQIQN
ncbi:hypothetical protein CHCC20372_3889 [Bacillus paralicheniformis]|nr:hypothetical protein CHCC20372_3889 [Bacillus paralicheniformis]